MGAAPDPYSVYTSLDAEMCEQIIDSSIISDIVMLTASLETFPDWCCMRRLSQL